MGGRDRAKREGACTPPGHAVGDEDLLPVAARTELEPAERLELEEVPEVLGREVDGAREERVGAGL